MAHTDITSLGSTRDPTSNTDLDRLRNEYADRELRFAGTGTYSLSNPGQLFIAQSRQRALLKLLTAREFDAWNNKDILEIGCGEGGVLREFLSYGADPNRLHGVELLDSRLEKARHLSPNFQLAHADAQHLPYPNDHFDLVAGFTVFTSILDDNIKLAIASEMLRVVRPCGLILWYDFLWNPANSQTRGIRAGEIRSLFPNCDYTFRRVTLAPPISRFLARYTWLGCQLLDSLRFLSSHYLVAIRPQRSNER